MSRVKRSLFLFFGVLSVSLGLLGILFPVLPTTPFLLLAAYLFARSSDRALHWLLTNRWFGGYIRRYREGRGMARRDKLLTLALLWLTIGASVALFIENPWVRAGLVLVALGVTLHLARLSESAVPDHSASATASPTRLPDNAADSP